MTAEERAAQMSWKHCPGGEGHEGESSGMSCAWVCPRCHADEFRACEAAAYERAAKALESTADGVGSLGIDTRAIYARAAWREAADLIRSLSPKETP